MSYYFGIIVCMYYLKINVIIIFKARLKQKMDTKLNNNTYTVQQIYEYLELFNDDLRNSFSQCTSYLCVPLTTVLSQTTIYTKLWRFSTQQEMLSG